MSYNVLHTHSNLEDVLIWKKNPKEKDDKFIKNNHTDNRFSLKWKEKAQAVYDLPPGSHSPFCQNLNEKWLPGDYILLIYYPFPLEIISILILHLRDCCVQ